MDITTIIAISIGLAMDCFAVSITKGITCGAKHFVQDRPSLVHSWAGPLLMAFLFGFFQGGMPLIGYFAGTIFADFFSKFAPWIALLLLGFIGGKMIWESFHEDTDAEEQTGEFTLKELFLLAIATSIDALATGVIFIPCPEIVWLGIGIIAITSFLFSIVGYTIGVTAGKRFHFNVELLGGIILVIIGLKIWTEGFLLEYLAL